MPSYNLNLLGFFAFSTITHCSKHQSYTHLFFVLSKGRSGRVWSRTNVYSDNSLQVACDKCGRRVYKPSMEKHMAKYHDPANTHVCDRCSCRFKDEVGVANHRRQCGGTNEATWKQFPCDCGRAFSSKAGFTFERLYEGGCLG